MLNKYLETFLPLIDSISKFDGFVDTNSNVVIGGINAIKAHGLIINREPSDLDLIIYNPTDFQWKRLEDLKFFEVPNSQRGEIEYIKEQKSFKFKKDGLIIDVLTEPDVKTPENLLFYEYKGRLFKIQNTELVFEAKRKYYKQFCLDYSKLENFTRTKDVKDMIDLKNSNFNIY